MDASNVYIDVSQDAVPLTDEPNNLTNMQDSSTCANSKLSQMTDEEFVQKHFEHLSPELKVGFYDVLILYHEDDYKRAEELRQHICNIDLGNGVKLKAAMHDDPDFMSLSGGKFEHLEQVFKRCTFAFVFLSAIFVKDKWCKIISQSFMIKMINDTSKMWSVVPVLTSQRSKLDFEIPLGLNAIRELKFYSPINLFNRCVKTLVSDKYNVRAENERSLLSLRLAFLSSKLGICVGVSENTPANASARSDDVLVEQDRDEGFFTKGVQELKLDSTRQTTDIDDLVSDRTTCAIHAKSSSTRQSTDVDDLETDCTTCAIHVKSSSTRQTTDVDDIETGCTTCTIHAKSSSIRQSSSGCNSPCQSNFLKQNDDKDLIRNNRLVSRASHSVGIIKGPFSFGTGFRVGTKYLATARHVVFQNAALNGEIDRKKIRSCKLFVEFEYICESQQHKEANIFYFRNVSYENVTLDTIVLELMEEHGKNFPPPISFIADLNRSSPVYIIGHPNGLPQMVDPKISFYTYNKEKVDKSKVWAASKGITGEDYIDIENEDKVLFDCASQHGASGALGVMIDQSVDEPQCVLMLLKGFPNFYYGKSSFTDSDKENFLIVEQGVLLSSVYKDMERQPEYDCIVKDILGTLQNPEED